MKSTLVLLILAITLISSIAVGSNTYTYAKSDNSNNNNRQEDVQQAVESSDDETSTSSSAAEDPTPGVGNNDNELGQDNPQPDRVGSHDNDQQTSGEGSNSGGTVTDPTLCSTASGENNPECSTTVTSNCFGKVISHEAQEHKTNPDEGTLGEHSRDPVPELEGNETPRQGIGNQDQGHPAAHGAFNSQFDEDDEENVNDNC